MTRAAVQLSGRESPFRDDEMIISKTDLKGRITYANDVFLRVSGYTAREIIGQPHNIIRHPDMPRAVFKLLWDTLQAKGEIFAYVLNLAKNGDHYWVFAHVTPSFDANGAVVGYHSNRRKPDAAAVARIVPVYKALLDDERSEADRKLGMHKAFDHLIADLETRGIAYDEFVFTL